jgi:succinate dehydrogenase hydrophobic anchor subunit
LTASDIEKAERVSRARSLIMAIAAIVLLIQAVLGVGDESASMTPVLRHASWGIMILFWLIILATGGWLRLRRSVRDLVNDEVALANRSVALQTGFWTAMLLALLLYFASLAWPISLRDGLRILTDVTIAAALIRYAWLELR